MQSNYDKQIDIARKIFLTYDMEKLAMKFGLPIDDEFMHIEYLNEPYFIDRTTGTLYAKANWMTPKRLKDGGRVSEGRRLCAGDEEYIELRSYNTVLTIYDMLCHSEYAPLPKLSGQWTPVSAFSVSGTSPDANVFAQRYADRFSGHIPELRAACESIGARLLEPLAGADVTAEIPAFTFFPVLLQFWEGDDEFAPQIRILWDTKTMEYLRFETTYYLQGDLLARLAELMEG